MMVLKFCNEEDCESTYTSYPRNDEDSTDRVGKYLCVGTGYIYEELIGSGRFGDVWLAKNVLDESDRVAVKIQYAEKYFRQLMNELIFYTKAGLSPYIPRFFHYCKHSSYHALVLEYLGPNLEQVFVRNSRYFSVKTILLIALRLIRVIEFVHRKKFVHRDIKPDNFLIRFNRDGSQSICLADFGLTKSYVDLKTQKHIPYTQSTHISGTIRFMSLNAHRGVQFSRRDDLESLSYVLIYLIKGHLPWRRLKKSEGKSLNIKVMEKKEETDFDEYLEHYSPVWGKFVEYSRNLEFKEDPNYDYCYNLFWREFKSHRYTNYDFDWHIFGDSPENSADENQPNIFPNTPLPKEENREEEKPNKTITPDADNSDVLIRENTLMSIESIVSTIISFLSRVISVRVYFNSFGNLLLSTLENLQRFISFSWR